MLIKDKFAYFSSDQTKSGSMNFGSKSYADIVDAIPESSNGSIKCIVKQVYYFCGFFFNARSSYFQDFFKKWGKSKVHSYFFFFRCNLFTSTA